MHVCSTLWSGALADDLEMDATTRAEHERRRRLHYERIVRHGAIYSQPFSEGGAAAAGAAPNARQLFTQGSSTTGATACGACHTLSEAGTSGTTGPNLDQVLKGKNAAFIRQSILQPNAVIAKGYPKGIMPPNYGSTLKPAEVDALVKYLTDVATK
jgi:mono/diheme cytochrome c family protein